MISVSLVLFELAAKLDEEGSVPQIITARDAIFREISKEQFKDAQTILAEMGRQESFDKPIDDYLARQSAQSKKKSSTKASQASGQDSMFPARPAKRPGVVTCNTRCINGDCWRTYDDGSKLCFQASSQWKWDEGGC
ncbi:hypothetical protein [Thauera linaloolentis]|uniref:Uncharacterized protein n=1 Tax=Thauera linaloolentis (strain DSM 12138 / JCM 21573 / CCUG 41526 / CIP 105981 / IAM 15112 / NBRC 102519 / 47Lol) TaxID=1123367 RepID=N6XPI5_THAL4|nr:hypothetical protein [Thauera linaloolentis]ENO83606.1 hypothetical protein C666_18675 [Thauera linaloolentis 47Lol = DSM 12138]MCM8567724.1 hypothetical protein [Thauera linaloolentis]